MINISQNHPSNDNDHLISDSPDDKQSELGKINNSDNKDVIETENELC